MPLNHSLTFHFFHLKKKKKTALIKALATELLIGRVTYPTRSKTTVCVQFPT